MERRFGHSFKIQEAFRERLERWPKIGHKDGEALQKYAYILRSCLDAKPYVKGLSVLDDCKENQKMTSKLPDWVITRWSRMVSESLEQSTEYPTFEQFVVFVEKEARAACHRVASISAVKGAGLTYSKHQTAKDKSFRSLVTDQKSRSTKIIDRTNKLCPFCKSEHHLADCVKFAEKGLEERNTYIQAEKRCFGCLRTGHYTKQCKVRHTRRTCQGRHPTVLHDDSRRSGCRPVQQNPSQTNQPRAVSLNTDCGDTSTTNVVPVWVSSVDNPKAERLVYALLDTHSDSTFIEERVCDELGASTNPVKLRLSTLLGKNVAVTCKRVEGLRIGGYTSAHYIDLPVT